MFHHSATCPGEWSAATLLFSFFSRCLGKPKPGHVPPEWRADASRPLLSPHKSWKTDRKMATRRKAGQALACAVTAGSPGANEELDLSRLEECLRSSRTFCTKAAGVAGAGLRR